jgi:hypothetical protein
MTTLPDPQSAFDVSRSDGQHQVYTVDDRSQLESIIEKVPFSSRAS